jgi:hypothetical protein
MEILTFVIEGWGESHADRYRSVGAAGVGVTWARANTTSASTTISTTSNSSRRNFAQGSGGRARIGDRSESLGIATAKLEELAVTARHRFQEAMERVGPISSSASCYLSEPLRD